MTNEQNLSGHPRAILRHVRAAVWAETSMNAMLEATVVAATTQRLADFEQEAVAGRE
jgi:hypothetical protein